MSAPAARGGVHWGGGILKSDMCASVKAYAIKLLANLIRGIESGSIVMQAEVLVDALIALHLLRPAAPCSRPSASVIQKLQRQLDTCFDSIERRRTIRHRRRHDLNSCLRLTTYGLINMYQEAEGSALIVESNRKEREIFLGHSHQVGEDTSHVEE